MSKPATPPITIPAIAPFDKAEEEEVDSEGMIEPPEEACEAAELLGTNRDAELLGAGGAGAEELGTVTLAEEPDETGGEK